MFCEAIYFLFICSLPLYRNSSVLWTWRKFTSWSAPSEFSLLIFLVAFSFPSKIPSAGRTNEIARCHQVENYSVSALSPTNPFMREMWSRTLRPRLCEAQPANVSVRSRR